MRFWQDVGGFANTELIIPFWKVIVMTLEQEKAEMGGVMHTRTFHSVLTIAAKIWTEFPPLHSTWAGAYILGLLPPLDLSSLDFLDAFHITTLDKFPFLEQSALGGGRYTRATMLLIIFLILFAWCAVAVPCLFTFSNIEASAPNGGMGWFGDSLVVPQPFKRHVTNIPRFGADKSGRWPKHPDNSGKTEIAYCYENKAAKDELEGVIAEGWGAWQRSLDRWGKESGHSLLFIRRLVPGQDIYCYLANGEWNQLFPADTVVIKRGAPGGWAAASSLGYRAEGSPCRHQLSIGNAEQAPNRDLAWGKLRSNF